MGIEARILENLHDIFCGSVVVGQHFILTHHLGQLWGVWLGVGGLHVGQDLLILFLSFAGVESIGLLAEESVDNLLALWI